jgi:hypothetical protein
MQIQQCLILRTITVETVAKPIIFYNAYCNFGFWCKTSIITGIFAVGLVVELVLYFKKDELIEWCKATFDLAKKIVPLFILCFFSGCMKR